jgi:hypothetical protein
MHEADVGDGQRILHAVTGIRLQANQFCRSEKYFAVAVTGYGKPSNYLLDRNHSVQALMRRHPHHLETKL